jgi:hypothetical protein
MANFELLIGTILSMELNFNVLCLLVGGKENKSKRTSNVPLMSR